MLKTEKNRDLFIDFLKGLCIICVVLTHNLPQSVQKSIVFIAWGGMAVPLFLLLQSYHVFHSDKLRREKCLKQKSYREHYCLSKIWYRIARPFIIVTLLTGSILLIWGHDPAELIKGMIINGGIGPGCYYVWIYLQFFLLLPLCLTFINKMGGGMMTLLLFILVSQGVEWLCIYIDIPDPVYRLCSFRYLFLIYLGYIWTTNKISQNLSIEYILVSFVSLAILLVLYYTTGDLKPFLYDTAWRSYHWICYLYVALLLPWIIRKLYDHLPSRIRSFIGEIGKWSYEIFLFQMMVFTILHPKCFSVGNGNLTIVIFMVSTTLLTIFPVLICKKYL